MWVGTKNNRGHHVFGEGADEAQQTDDRQNRGHQRQDEGEEDAGMACTVHPGSLVEGLRHGVEEAVHEVGVRSQGSAQVHHDERQPGPDAQHRVDVTEPCQ